MDLNESQIISRPRASDLLSIQGLTTITGISWEDLDLYLLKELLDNALDAIEETRTSKGEVSVSFISEEDRVTLSVSDNGIGLNRRDLEKITDLNNFSSSKQFYKNPKRGAQGNAFKVVLCAPLVLASLKEAAIIEPPVTVRSRKYLHHLGVNAEKSQNWTKTIEKDEDLQGTEITVTIPKINKHWGFRQAYVDLLTAYSILNPAISFKLKLIHPKGEHDPLDYTFKPSKPMEKIYSGAPSIHWYTFNEFQQYLEGISKTEPEITIDDVLLKFRGFTSPKKRREFYQQNELAKTSKITKIGSENHIRLYQNMRQTSKCPEPSIQARIGQKQLLTQISNNIHTPTSSIYKFKAENPSEDGVYNPYLLEVILATFHKKHQTQRKIITGINGTPCLNNPFTRTIFKIKRKNKETHCYGIYDLLEKLHIKSEDPVLIIINLSSPSVKYTNYGKSEFNTPTYTETLESLIDSCSTFYYKQKRGGHGPSNKSMARKLLEEEIEHRVSLVKRYGKIPDNLWTTQQSLFYKIRNSMGGETDIKRDSLIDAIRPECEKRGYKRITLGIITAVRAELRFRGKDYPVSWNNISELARLGSDIIVVEKEGVSVALAPYADQMGVGLLTSRGFIVEYAEELISEMKGSGANIYLLTDFDASGISISQKVPNIARIGIDLTTLKELGLKLGSVVEEYKPRKEHLADVPKEHLEFLKNRRIEIDSVLAAIGPDRFWTHLTEKMTSIHPTRNLNRSMNIEVNMPEEFTALINELLKQIKKIALDEKKNIDKMHQTWTRGLTKVSEREQTFNKLLTKIVEKDPKYTAAFQVIKNLLDALNT